MNSGDDAKDRLRIAVGFCDEAERNFNRSEWRACVDDAQLAVENAAKALISCFHPAARTHEPEKELQDILDIHKNLPADVMAAISAVIACCQELGWEEHVRTDYGDELTRRTPWELFGEPEATNALQKARETIQHVEHVVEHFCLTPPPSPALG
jgi:HEPN domain-containing protein